MKHNRNPFLILLTACSMAVASSHAAEITLTQDDATGTNSFTSAGNWSNGLAPSAGNDYSVTGDGTTFNLRAPTNATFAGDSLTINNGGILAWAPSSNTGTLTVSNLILNGGGVANFRTSGTLTLAGNVNVTAASALRLGSGANTSVRNITLNSTVTGNGRLQMLAQNNSVSTLSVNGDNSTFTGGFLLSGNAAESDNSVLTVGHANALGSGTTTVDQGTLNLNGFSVTIGGLAGAPTVGADSFVQNNSDTAATLTVNSGSDTMFAGVIRNGSGTGNLGLAKSGAGSLTLTGANSYTGATLVSAGTLYVSGALSGSAVTVEANGTIGSNGLAGALGNGLTIEAGGNLDLTGGTIGFASTGILSLTGGSLTLGNLTFEDIVGWDWMNADVGTYKLIDGAFSVDFGDTAFLDASTAYDFGNGKMGYFTSGSLNAVIVAIPEPSTALLGALGMLALLRRRRA